MKLVTFETRTGHQITKEFSELPHENGFVPANNIKLKAMALNWTVVEIKDGPEELPAIDTGKGGLK